MQSAMPDLKGEKEVRPGVVLIVFVRFLVRDGLSRSCDDELRYQDTEMVGIKNNQTIVASLTTESRDELRVS